MARGLGHCGLAHKLEKDHVLDACAGAALAPLVDSICQVQLRGSAEQIRKALEPMSSKGIDDGAQGVVSEAQRLLQRVLMHCVDLSVLPDSGSSTEAAEVTGAAAKPRSADC